MAHRYSARTKVSVGKSRAEIEHLLAQYGATSTAVFTSVTEAAVAFEMDGRRILFRLAMPAADDREFTHKKVNQFGGEARRPDDAARKAHDAACQQRWRTLLLAIKAKLVAVDEGVETFEEAFMAHVVMPDGRTVGEHVKPRIQSAYESGTMQPLLPPPTQ